MTTGILLQHLRFDSSGFSKSRILGKFSHLIIDEVHERDEKIDYLLAILKTAIKDRIVNGLPVPRITLMSATLDTALFSGYLSDPLFGGPPAVLNVPGRAFPVQHYYLDDIIDILSSAHGSKQLARHLSSDPTTKEYLTIEGEFSRTNFLKDVDIEESYRGESTIKWSEKEVDLKWSNKTEASTEVEEIAAEQSNSAGTLDAEQLDSPVPLRLVSSTVIHICKTTTEGAILVFLPGIDQIYDVYYDLLRSGPYFEDADRCRIYLLHSSLRDAQRQVFAPVPVGVKKIILSTNIAETSITIPDVQHIVDTGKSNQNIYDQIDRSVQLKSGWISKSSLKQRAGRAGRVQNGNYYALFTKARSQALLRSDVPAILRSDLQAICLDMKSQGLGGSIQQFMKSTIESPSTASLAGAIIDLIDLGALALPKQMTLSPVSEVSEILTPMGRLLSLLPLQPRLAKLVILGIVYRCLDPMIILGVSLEERSLFVGTQRTAQEVDDKKRRFALGSNSDMFSNLNAFHFLRNQLQHGTTDAEVERVANWNLLSIPAFKALEASCSHVESYLETNGLIPYSNGLHYGPAHLNENSANDELIKALLISAFSLNLAKSGRKSFYKISDGREGLLFEHSVNFATREKWPTTPRLLTFNMLVRAELPNKSTYRLRDTTRVTPLAVALFGPIVSGVNPGMAEEQPRPVDTYSPKGSLQVKGGGFALHCSAEEEKIVMRLRNGLRNMENIMFNDMNSLKNRGKVRSLFSNDTYNKLVESVATLLTNSSKASSDGMPVSLVSRTQRLEDMLSNADVEFEDAGD
jgi:ATP-dependent RNA helicase DHX36